MSPKKRVLEEMLGKTPQNETNSRKIAKSETGPLGPIRPATSSANVKEPFSGNNEDSESNPGYQRSAQAWATAQKAHLRRLKDSPALADACASLVGKKAMKIASKLEAALAAWHPSDASSEQSASRSISSTKSCWNEDAPSTPPLPEVHDRDMARLPFVHRSTLSTDQINLSNNLDYERLEFAGDSYLQTICTKIIWAHFPNAEVGKLSTLRQQLVCNATLSDFSKLYGFDQRLKLNTGDRPLGKAWVKLIADVFEAYVAAVIHSRPSDGYQVVEEWMRLLWAPLLPEEQALAGEKGAKDRLTLKLISKGVRISYEQTRPPRRDRPGSELFTIGVFLTGWGWKHTLLAEGMGHSKMQAGQDAAEKALRNPQTDKISLVKSKYDALLKAEQAREGGPRPEVLDALNKDFT